MLNNTERSEKCPPENPSCRWWWSTDLYWYLALNDRERHHSSEAGWPPGDRWRLAGGRWCPDGVKSLLLSGAGGHRTDGANFLLVRGVMDLQSG